MEKKYYTDFLRANGIDPHKSASVKHFGDGEYYPEAYSQFQNEETLNKERHFQKSFEQLEEMKKREAEYESKKISERELIEMLQLEILKRYPKESVKPVYHDLYVNGLTRLMAKDMLNHAKFAIQDAKIIMNAKEQEGNENKTGTLQKIMNKAKVSIKANELSFDDVVYKAFSDNEGYKFLK